jgi:LDH2 family malate/lactate/ureidoglycolate dehydrogenase
LATAVEHCAALAVAGGFAITTVTELTRVGRLGTYAAWGAEQGLVSVVAVDAPPAVAPYGGTEAALGTNPLAFAIPGSPAIVADFATSAMTEAAASAAGRTGVLQPRGGLVGTLVGLFVEALTGAIEGRSPDRTGRTATVIMVEPRDQPATAVFVENLERAFLDAGAQLPGWRRREQLDRPQSIEMPTAIHRMLVEGGKAGVPETESPGESV